MTGNKKHPPPHPAPKRHSRESGNPGMGRAGRPPTAAAPLHRHSRESGNPVMGGASPLQPQPLATALPPSIQPPATVIPAKAGIQEWPVRWPTPLPPATSSIRHSPETANPGPGGAGRQLPSQHRAVRPPALTTQWLATIFISNFAAIPLPEAGPGPNAAKRSGPMRAKRI